MTHSYECDALIKPWIVNAFLVCEGILGFILVLSFFETQILMQAVLGIGLFTHCVLIAEDSL